MLYARAEVCKIVSSLYAALTDVSSEPIESCSREAVEDRLRDAIEARVAKRFPKLMVFRVHTAVKSTSKTGSRPGTFARPWRPVASSKGELQAIIAKKCVTRAPARAAGHATPFKVRPPRARRRARRRAPAEQPLVAHRSLRRTSQLRRRGRHRSAVTTRRRCLLRSCTRKHCGWRRSRAESS